MSIKSSLRDASVLVTGHTGFKGSWICLLLEALGARVTGIALPPPTHPSLFKLVGIESRLAASHIVDVRDAAAVRTHIQATEPDIVFHMAAQPLVLKSYHDPIETFASNIMGTVHVLDALRGLKKSASVVIITSDKCYKNLESQTPYTEDSPLGGDDPYTASKACAEIVSGAYRHAFFSSADIALATARAGNVLGGGDFGANRLIPDLYRAAASGTALRIRYPNAVRPWQYVLDVLWGYLILATELKARKPFAVDAFNFAPPNATPVPVSAIVKQMTQIWDIPVPVEYEAPTHPETGVLRIDSSKATETLGWRSKMDTHTMLAETAAWYKEFLSGGDMVRMTHNQVDAYIAHV